MTAGIFPMSSKLILRQVLCVLAAVGLWVLAKADVHSEFSVIAQWAPLLLPLLGPFVAPKGWTIRQSIVASAIGLIGSAVVVIYIGAVFFGEAP